VIIRRSRRDAGIEFQTFHHVVSGEAPGGGLTYGPGALQFADGKATFIESDLAWEVGYTCTDGIVVGQGRHHGWEGTVRVAGDRQVTVYWNGELYEPVTGATAHG